MQCRRNEFESRGWSPVNFFCRTPPLFDYTGTNSLFGELFGDGQYSLVSLLFAVLLLTVPRAQLFL